VKWQAGEVSRKKALVPTKEKTRARAFVKGRKAVLVVDKKRRGDIRPGDRVFGTLGQDGKTFLKEGSLSGRERD